MFFFCPFGFGHTQISQHHSSHNCLRTVSPTRAFFLGLGWFSAPGLTLAPALSCTMFPSSFPALPLLITCSQHCFCFQGRNAPHSHFNDSPSDRPVLHCHSFLNLSPAVSACLTPRCEMQWVETRARFFKQVIFKYLKSTDPNLGPNQNLGLHSGQVSSHLLGS